MRRNTRAVETWRAFKIQFQEYSRIYRITQTRLDRLMASLRGKALLFIGKKDKSERRDYKKLMKALERRCGQELPSSNRKQLLVASQESAESLEDFAERVYTFTTDGYPEAGKDLLETLPTDYFLKGCYVEISTQPCPFQISICINTPES